MSRDRIFDAVVVGAGPAGVQCAVLLRRLDVDLLLIGDLAPSVRHGFLPRERGWNSSDIADEVSLRLARENVDALAALSVPVLADCVLSVTRRGGLLHVEIPSQTLLARSVVLATGAEGAKDARVPVVPDIEALDLDRHEDGMIEVDEDFGASTTGVYAIGDLAGGYVDSVSCAMGTASRAARSVSRFLRAAKARVAQAA